MSILLALLAVVAVAVAQNWRDISWELRNGLGMFLLGCCAIVAVVVMIGALLVIAYSVI